MADERENFGSKLGTVLAAAGSAVGLGNIWRFPIETGQHGGAAYIIIYVLCIIMLGIPIMLAEFIIGRRSHSNAVGAYHKLAPGTQWKWVGRLSVLAVFIVTCYYVVVAGWTFEYMVLAMSNAFEGKHANDYVEMFSTFSSNPWQPLVCMVALFLITHIIVVHGVNKGIERFSKMMMPMLFIIAIILVVCSVNLDGASKGIDFLLRPDFSKITGSTILNAMGQAFYSLSLGMGILCTYASYFRKDLNMVKTTLNVCAIDTLVAIMSGFIIFPAVFHAGYELQPSDIGPSLIFITLPNIFQSAFQGVPVLGYIFSVMFYLLLIVAAITSTISMHEVMDAYVCEEFKIRRKKATALVTACCMFFGVFCCLSFGPLADVKICHMTIFGIFDFVSSNILLPLSGMLASIFVGWYLKKKVIEEELTNDGVLRVPMLNVLAFLLKYIAPAAIGVIFLKNFGIF